MRQTKSINPEATISVSQITSIKLISLINKLQWEEKWIFSVHQEQVQMSVVVGYNYCIHQILPASGNN